MAYLQTEDRETRMMRYVSNTPPPAVGGGQGAGETTLGASTLVPEREIKKRSFMLFSNPISCFS